MNLPKLPGYTIYDPRKTDYRKGQFLNVTAGLMGQRTPSPDDLEKTALQVTQRAGPTTRAPPTQPVSTFPDYIPAHVAFEHLVLRFYAYFRESIPESANETYRVRYVRIHVYLEDDTIMIEEYRIRNSGMEQGVILRRMKVTNPRFLEQGVHYSKDDFNTGIDIDIFGTVYHIYACDKFTEEYFRDTNRELNEFENAPDDLYSIKRKLTDRPIRVTYINTDKTNLRRFLDFDGKVLRFYTTWDDRRALFGEKRKFILHFFLVDGTIEIRQVLPLNSGRDPVSQFLKKTLLKKPNSTELYTDADLRIGTTVNVFDREFFIYDADDFTKEFIDTKFGQQDWSPIAIEDYSYGQPTKPTQKIVPPYNGWGDEEDSLGYVYSLHPKPPRKDVVKLISKDGMILRFAARFTHPQEQDKNRKFVIGYYLADDTVAVFELPARNSGFREGKFIQRAKLKNVKAGGRYFTAADFKVGEEVIINSYEFTTYDADEYAMNYMESQADDFPQSDLFNIIQQLRRNREKVENIRKDFEKDDPEIRGYVSTKQAENAIIKNFGLDLHEARTIARRWSDEKNGFDYFSLMSVLA